MYRGKMPGPKVTVLMPVFNAERFLAEAIESILSQTFTDFEFLIIDDGSSDNSLSIINSYNDHRIRFISNEKNLGISATLNKGIALSNTDLIARMDADDISYPQRLQKQYEHMSAHPDCALVSSWAREVSEDKRHLHVEKFNSRYYYYILNFECWIYHPTVMYRKGAVVDCGGYSEKYCEDYDLWWKLSRNNTITNIPEVLLDYRSTDSSLSRISKKTEYEEGHHKQVLRNVHYYTGPNFPLTDREIEWLRYNDEQKIDNRDITLIVDFFKKLDYINDSIFKKDADKEIDFIKEAAQFKKRLLLKWFLQKLPLNKKLQLLIQTGNWKLLGESIKNFPNRIFRRSILSPAV